MLNIELAKKYATALFELAQEEGKLEKYADELADICQSVLTVPGVKEFLANPQIENKAKKEFIKKVCKGELSTTVYHFLLLLVDKRRIALLSAVEEVYRTLSNRAQGIVIADVTTASDLSQNRERELKKKLSEVTGKKIKLRLHKDKKLIGGVVVRIGDKRIDGSVQGRLGSLHKDLLTTI
jgi:F-type H+-transporting ATPase subunit delta